jgi:hypothetical protein
MTDEKAIEYQRRWRESLDHNRRAADLDPADEASWWNMGTPLLAVQTNDLGVETVARYRLNR